MSKGLDALQRIYIGSLTVFDFKKDIETIEKELKRLEELEEEKQSFDRIIEKKLKALEIILKKKVNIYDEIYQTNDYEDYEENFGYAQAQFDLTEEEYDLLKGFVGNEKKR